MNYNPEHLVVLYSKYSPQCRRILQVYDEHSMDYIRLICIDNANIRKRISASKLGISTVPCVLLVYPDRKVEKFDGQGVMDWIMQQIRQNTPHSINTPVPQPEETEYYQQTAPSQPQQPQPQYTDRTSIDDIETTPEETKKKSVKELAAEMAAGRENADLPLHQMKRDN